MSVLRSVALLIGGRLRQLSRRRRLSAREALERSALRDAELAANRVLRDKGDEVERRGAVGALAGSLLIAHDASNLIEDGR